ncbi:MAG: FAD-binding oxidoreductase [Acidimicrobiales bacterium]
MTDPRSSASPLPDAARRDLLDAVGPRGLVIDADERASYEVDWTGRFHGQAPAVVRPADTAAAAAVVEVARRHGLALVPQGGNTGLVGGGVPLGGEVVVNLQRLDHVGEVDVLARQVTAGAGATLAAVRQAADAAGLRYAVDLAARDSATIGGNVATNAGGINLIRFGGTRQQVVGIEAVLGTGGVVSHLGGLLKDNTGYDLAGLLCGSEGTLGLVTAVRLKLVPKPVHTIVALVAFSSIDAAVAAVAAWHLDLDDLESAELVLDAGLHLVCDTFDRPPPFTTHWPAYVLVEVAGSTDPTDRLAAAVDGTDGVQDVAVAADAAHRTALWRYREEHTLAINTLGPPHKLDVTLPSHALAGFCDEVGDVVTAAAPEAQTWLFGHVGDGNIHVNVTGVAPDDERVDDAVLRYVADLGGSISAEHGIGTAKRGWLSLVRAPAELAAMRAIKAALDPDGICNPNALLPPA